LNKSQWKRPHTYTRAHDPGEECGLTFFPVPAGTLLVSVPDGVRGP